MDLGLDGKLCVVTGASRGIGLEVGRSLCAEGGQVLFVGRDAEALVEAAEGCGGEYIAADVTDPEMAELIIATCAEQMGGIDVLVNNAGTSFARGLDELTDEDWQGQWELHVMAPMRLMRAAAPRMAAARRRADRQRLLERRQAPVADQRRLLGDQGRAALALARLRRRLRVGQRARQRGRAGRRRLGAVDRPRRPGRADRRRAGRHRARRRSRRRRARSRSGAWPSRARSPTSWSSCAASGRAT